MEPKAFFILLLEILQADFWELKQKLWLFGASEIQTTPPKRKIFQGFYRSSSLGLNLLVFLLHSFSSNLPCAHGPLRWPHWQKFHSKQSSSLSSLRELLENNIGCSVLDNWPEQSVHVKLSNLHVCAAPMFMTLMSLPSVWIHHNQTVWFWWQELSAGKAEKEMRFSPVHRLHIYF